MVCCLSLLLLTPLLNAGAVGAQHQPRRTSKRRAVPPQHARPHPEGARRAADCWRRRGGVERRCVGGATPPASRQRAKSAKRQTPAEAQACHDIQHRRVGRESAPCRFVSSRALRQWGDSELPSLCSVHCVATPHKSCMATRSLSRAVQRQKFQAERTYIGRATAIPRSLSDRLSFLLYFFNVFFYRKIVPIFL